MSKGENLIVELLDNANIKYKREVTFPGLYGLNKLQLRFDFVAYNDDDTIKALIEVDGIQHYAFQKRFYRTFKDFNRAKEWDRKKNRFCLAHKYPLYRIPYWEEQTLKTADDIFSDRFLVRSQWHSDEMIMTLKEQGKLPKELQ